MVPGELVGASTERARYERKSWWWRTTLDLALARDLLKRKDFGGASRTAEDDWPGRQDAPDLV